MDGVICNKCGFCHAYGSRYGTIGHLCYHPGNMIVTQDYVRGKTERSAPECRSVNPDGKCEKFQPEPNDTRSWWKKFFLPHSHKAWKFKVKETGETWKS